MGSNNSVIDRNQARRGNQALLLLRLRRRPARTGVRAPKAPSSVHITPVLADPRRGRETRKPDGRLGRSRAALVRRAPGLASRLAWLLGLLALVDAVLPHHWVSQFTPLTTSALRASVHVLLAVSGVLLLRIAAGLRRRKRGEWAIAVAACTGIIVADLVRAERRPAEALVALVLLTCLVIGRSRFTARADPRSRWFAVRLGLQFGAAGLIYGVVWLSLPGHAQSSVSFGAKLEEVARSLIGLGGSTVVAHSKPFHATLLAFGILAIASTLIVALRPVEASPTLAADDEQRLRTLLDAQGARDSLGYFALRRDKSVVWSASGKAAITYRVVAGVALVSADPIGDPEAWPGAIEAYAKLIDRYGWTPAVMGCSEQGATIFKREYRLCALELGDEAVLSRTTFDLGGRSMRCVRQACHRVERAGYTAVVRRVRDIPNAELEQIHRAADRWRGEQVERGFSMALSRVGDPADGQCVIVTAHRDGALAGLLHFVPWSGDGLSLDLMRRDRNSDNGLNEFMITGLMASCGELGVDRVSLNFAVFRDALERGAGVGAGPILRLWRGVLLIASRWWQIESLFRFNSKFRPEWQPRFICFPGARDVPRIAYAAMEAEAFIVRPRFLRRMAGRD